MERKRLGISITILLSLLLFISNCTNNRQIVNSASIPCNNLKSCIVEAINDPEMSSYYRKVNGNPVFLVDSTYQCPQLFTFLKFDQVNNLIRLGNKSVDDENIVVIKILAENEEQISIIMTYKFEGIKMTRRYKIKDNDILLIGKEVVEN